MSCFRDKLRKLKEWKFAYFLYKFFYLQKLERLEGRVFLQLKNIEKLDGKKIKNLQEKKLLEILSHANKNSLYYREVFKKNNIEPENINSLNRIPILTKKIIKENITRIVCKDYNVNSLIKRNTGGSTGEPLQFFTDKMAGHIDNAHHWYLYSIMGFQPGDTIISSGGLSIPSALRSENIYWKKTDDNSVWGSHLFSVLYINDENIQFYIDKIFELKPKILRGYPSFYNKLATYMLINKLEPSFEIKGINLTAEMCSLTQRSNIERAFCTQVYFEYGHSELCLYCYTKDNSYTYLSSPIYGYIEVIKDNGEEAAVGEVGNIFATSFCNYGMPFIRYETGDRGEVLYRNGGIIHFKNIYGRSQDYIISKTGQKIYLIGLIFGQHLKAFKNIIQWQLVQDTAGLVNFYIIKSNDYSQQDEKDIVEKIKGIADIDINFNYVERIPMTSSGKNLFFVQNIK